MAIEVFYKTDCLHWLNAHKYDHDLEQSRTGVTLPDLKFSICFSLPADPEPDATRQDIDWLAREIPRRLHTDNALMTFSDLICMLNDDEMPEMPLALAQYRKNRWSRPDDPESCPRAYRWNAQHPEDCSAISDILRFIMKFNWEAMVLPAHGQSAVWLADEVVELRTSHKLWFDDFRKDLNSLGVNVFRVHDQARQ
jgi:hypothetical protein